MRILTKQEILNRLLQKAREIYPEAIWAPGVPSTDFAITIPLEIGYDVFIFALFTMLVTSGEKGLVTLAQDTLLLEEIARIMGITVDELKQNILTDASGSPLTMYRPIIPLGATPSTGVVRVWVSGPTQITIPEELRFIDRRGEAYYPLVWGPLTPTEDTSVSPSQYYIDIPVKSVSTGTKTNIPAGHMVSFTVPDTYASLYSQILRVENPSAFTGGSDGETLESYAERVGKWFGLKFGFTYMAYLEQVLLENGATEVQVIRSGHEHFVRGSGGMDLYFRTGSQVLLSPDISTDSAGFEQSRALYEPVMMVNGSMYLPATPEENGYVLSVKQYTPLSSGTTFRYNVMVRHLQDIVDRTDLWWLGSALVLVKSAFPIYLDVFVSGRLDPNYTVADVEECLASKIDEIGIGGKLYISSLADWLLECGMSYIELDSLQVNIFYPTVAQYTASDLEVPIAFWQYPVLSSLTVTTTSSGGGLV